MNTRNTKIIEFNNQLREIDFLNLITDEDFKNQYFVITGNVLYNEDTTIEDNLKEWIDFLKWIKEGYNDLEKFKIKLEERVKKYHKEHFINKKNQEIINKIDKYLEYKRLEAKYAVKNTTEKRSKI